jgi:hypothetical protein
LNGGELPLYLSFVVLITIFCLSLLSWRYVELPFRKQIDFKNAAQVKLALVSVSLLLLVGALGHLKNGFERDQSQSLEVNSSKKITNENFFVLGDSHAEHLVAGIQSITTGKVTALVSAGCIPFRNVDRYDSRLPKGECAKKSNMWLDEVLKIDPKATVILTSMGPVYLEGTAFKGMDTARVTGLGVELINDKSEKNRYRVFEIGMENTLSELSKLRNSLIVYAIDVPELGIKNGCQIRSKSIAIYGSILTDFTETTKPDHCNIPRSQYEERSTKYRNLVRSVVNEFPNIKLFDPIDTFCDRSKCDGYKIKYGYLYQDADHLSGSGSRLYAENLFKFIEKEVAKRK